MTSSLDDHNARRITKGRTWKQISTAAESSDEPLPDDYASELELFERGDINKAIWAKHLVESKGDADQAKWAYIKDRAESAPSRRAEKQRLQKEESLRAFAESQRIKKQLAEEKRKEEQLKRDQEEIDEQRRMEDARAKRIEEKRARRGVEEEKDGSKGNQVKRDLRQETSQELEDDTSRSILDKQMSPPQSFGNEPSQINRDDSGARQVRLAVFWLVGIPVIVLTAVLMLSHERPHYNRSLATESSDERAESFSHSEVKRKAVAYINLSWQNFIGNNKPVNEQAALTIVQLAIAQLALIDSYEADMLKSVANNNLGVIYNCSVDKNVRDKDQGRVANSRIETLLDFHIENVFWDRFWGEKWEDLISTPEQRRAVIEKGESSWAIEYKSLHPDKVPLEVLTLAYEATPFGQQTHAEAALQLAYYFECRSEPQDLDLAIDWYRKAIDAVEENSDLTLKSRERLRRLLFFKPQKG